MYKHLSVDSIDFQTAVAHVFKLTFKITHCAFKTSQMIILVVRVYTPKTANARRFLIYL